MFFFLRWVFLTAHENGLFPWSTWDSSCVYSLILSPAGADSSRRLGALHTPIKNPKLLGLCCN
jgi:hypothetical protein